MEQMSCHACFESCLYMLPTCVNMHAKSHLGGLNNVVAKLNLCQNASAIILYNYILCFEIDLQMHLVRVPFVLLNH